MVIFILSKTLNLVGDCFHVKYCAHLLNLIIQNKLNEVAKSIEKVHECMNFIKDSIIRSDNFYKYISKLKTFKDSLVIDDNTRWNFT